MKKRRIPWRIVGGGAAAALLLAVAVWALLLSGSDSDEADNSGKPKDLLQATPAPASGDASSDQTLAQVRDTIIPVRDRVDLARRLSNLTDIPTPPAKAPEVKIGDVMTFKADNLEEDHEVQIEAELVYATEHVYMFVEVGYPVDLEAIQGSADRFETVIRPAVHRVFGTEGIPGIDGDPHLYILHASDLGNWVAAYYGGDSQYPAAAVPKSNEHEMFFVNLDTMGQFIGTPYYESILAHEFQHMVHGNVDLNEDNWLNEGLSELAVLIAGYGASDFSTAYLNQPEIQLTSWPEDDTRGLYYGASFLFMAYFYQRYGERATTTLVQDPANGLESITDTLAAIDATDPATGAPVTPVDLFADWVVTNLLLDPSIADGRYAYTLDDLSGLSSALYTYELAPDRAAEEAAAPQWGPHYVHISSGEETRRYRLTFDGERSVSIVPTQAHSGQFMWWSNRADESDSRLTQAFDLTNTSSATLTYWAWYSIEEGWDYGYVMVSTDGGSTWTPLETAHTTTDNPHSTAYGPGYSGDSGGWVQESVDLTPYAGQKILLRFEVITDDAVNNPGLLIDDVSIPEIGYSADFEDGAGGWSSEGWLHTNNVLPQDFLVQVVQPGNPEAPVVRLLGPGETPQGAWEISVGGSLGDATIVVSGLAPVTTEPAVYRVMLESVE